jgi:hypothetical protein
MEGRKEGKGRGGGIRGRRRIRMKIINWRLRLHCRHLSGQPLLVLHEKTWVLLISIATYYGDRLCNSCLHFLLSLCGRSERSSQQRKVKSQRLSTILTQPSFDPRPHCIGNLRHVWIRIGGDEVRPSEKGGDEANEILIPKDRGLEASCVELSSALVQ